MYTYEDYVKFQDKYISGVKSIAKQTSYPSISIQDEPIIKLKSTSENFHAFYNKNGNLIHVINLQRRSNYKYSYFYDNLNRVTKILEIHKETNVLSKENNIVYQDNDNFIEHIREYINSEYAMINEIRHSYENEIRIIERTNVSEDDWFLCQKITFDNVIQETFTIYNDSIDFVFISELNESNQVVKDYLFEIEYSVYGDVIGEDINYTPVEYHLNTYYGSGLLKSTCYVSKEPWTKSYEYIFNKRGHWIQEVICIDNSFQFICERKLEYF